MNCNEPAIKYAMMAKGQLGRRMLVMVEGGRFEIEGVLYEMLRGAEIRKLQVIICLVGYGGKRM